MTDTIIAFASFVAGVIAHAAVIKFGTKAAVQTETEAKTLETDISKKL